MRHQRRGRKLKRTGSHKKALMRNMATSLFEHKKIRTSEAKAKELRPFAENLISRAKKALAREQQGALPEGQSVDVHNRREVGRQIRNKAILQELFDAIAPVVEERTGGYTRIVKMGHRRGDSGRMAIIELVDWSAPQDGAVSTKKKKKKRKPKKEQPVEETTTKAEVEDTEEKEVEEPQAEAADTETKEPVEAEVETAGEEKAEPEAEEETKETEARETEEPQAEAEAETKEEKPQESEAKSEEPEAKDEEKTESKADESDEKEKDEEEDKKKDK